MRVMIVEDELPILELMKLLVGRHPHLEVVGAFQSAAEALEQFPRLQPDAALLDVEMPRMNGIELAGQLKRIDEEVQIVFTTAYPDYALEAFQVCAVDYLLKPVTPDGIERVAARLAKGQKLRAARPAEQEQQFVRCLGAFETRRAGGHLMSWPTRKTEELFAYFLVYPNRSTSKWQLADLLWPDLEEERAVHNVHNTVYRLKKALKEAGIGVEVVHANDGYHMQIAAACSDLGQFRELAGEARFRAYQGALFAGKDYVWSAGVAAELDVQYAEAARELVAKYRREGQAAKAKEALRTYLAYLPLDEEMNEQLLELYAAQEERELFRQHYAAYRNRLAEELGVAPSARIGRLAQQLGVQEGKGD
ncbi:response regulator receiver and SARP domain protein [Tumebacillus sp. BK434]|uniref:response regulator n=1 Tax=Tumebacillus sp. BK434 TaxID=2512169 RepID=UPI00104424F8|nr:response regulator [Tumebacillus sp. BK434]TCP55813.1 response regulator receiver and SARP domain protein [Tumebacillus sp. BK434]